MKQKYIYICIIKKHTKSVSFLSFILFLFLAEKRQRKYVYNGINNQNTSAGWDKDSQSGPCEPVSNSAVFYYTRLYSNGHNNKKNSEIVFETPLNNLNPALFINCI